jgi:protein SCO1
MVWSSLATTSMWSLLIAVIMVVLVAQGMHMTGASAAATLPRYNEVPNAPFMRQDGAMISLGALRGSVWVADFIFTRCGAQCPVMTQHMRALQQEFGSQVGLVSFSVDPSYDTPTRLAAYARQANAQDHWWFLTGTPAHIMEMAFDVFRLAAAVPGTADAPRTLPTHSARFVLVDTTGHIRGYYDSNAPDDLRTLRSHIRQLLTQRR